MPKKICKTCGSEFDTMFPNDLCPTCQFENSDTFSFDCIICPHCGNHFTPMPFGDEELYEERNRTEHICSKCGKKFIIQTLKFTAWETTKDY